MAGAQIVLVSVLGGASLDRYLMPAFPVLYAAIAAAGSRLSGKLAMGLARRHGLRAAVGLWWNPPYPFSFENNLAMTDFVSLQQERRELSGSARPNARIASAWPFTDELRRPEFGYVHHPMKVEQIDDFRLTVWPTLDRSKVDMLVVYCRGCGRWMAARSVAVAQRLPRTRVGHASPGDGGTDPRRARIHARDSVGSARPVDRDLFAANLARRRLSSED